jgi:hypothetical protein
MSRRTAMIGLLAALMVTPASPALALRCTLKPARPVAGHPLHWIIQARKSAPELPAIQPQDLPTSVKLLTQRRSTQGHTQSNRVTLYPLRPGPLTLPALRNAHGRCAARKLKVLADAPGATPHRFEVRIEPQQPRVGQALRVELRVDAASYLNWNRPQPKSDRMLFEPLPRSGGPATLDGQRVYQTVFAWRALPLAAGPTPIDFGTLRASSAGILRLYAAPSSQVLVRALPDWWPADGLVGRPQVTPLHLDRHLRIHHAGLWSLRIDAPGLTRRWLQRWLREALDRAPAGLTVYAPELRRVGNGHDPAFDAWEVRIWYRPSRTGELRLPRLHLPWLAPNSGLPQALDIGGARLRVTDPRPAQVAGIIGGLLLLLLLARGLRELAGLLRRRRRRRQALHALRAARTADELRAAWLHACASWAPKLPPASTVRRAASAAGLDPAQVAELEQHLYGRVSTAAPDAIGERLARTLARRNRSAQ